MTKLFYQCMCTCIHCFNLISRKRIKWGCFIIYPDISKKERCLASYKYSLWATNPCFLYKWRLRLPVGPPLDSNEKNYWVLLFWFKEAQPVLLHMWTCWRCSQGADPAQRRRRASREAWTEIAWPCFLSHRGTWREKYGGWQPTLSCPSAQRWATIKRFGSGNYPPNTVCWQYESSKKVWDATLHICQSICQQQRVLCSFCTQLLFRVPGTCPHVHQVMGSQCWLLQTDVPESWPDPLLPSFSLHCTDIYHLGAICPSSCGELWESVGTHQLVKNAVLSLCPTVSTTDFIRWKQKFYQKKVTIKKFCKYIFNTLTTRMKRCIPRSANLANVCWVASLCQLLGHPKMNCLISSVRDGQGLNRVPATDETILFK